MTPRATTTITVEEEEESRKGSDDEDDERSKMSAREPAVSDERRGVHVGYRPTHGEREGEGEQEQERLGDGHGATRLGQGIPDQSGSGLETYTQHTDQPSQDRVKAQASPKESPHGKTGHTGQEADYTRAESPKSVPATSTASDKDDVEEVVRLAKTPGANFTLTSYNGVK